MGPVRRWITLGAAFHTAPLFQGVSQPGGLGARAAPGSWHQRHHLCRCIGRLGGCFRGVNWMQRRPHTYGAFGDEKNVGGLLVREY